MKKKLIVISLGGSLIVPKEMNVSFLKEFKKTLQSNYSRYKFVVVCGGGVTARRYISVLKKDGKSKKELSFAGIRATRMNAIFMMQFFGREANGSLPGNMKEVKDNLEKNKVVLCGALRYDDKATSDTTAAKIAKYLGTDFINMTNVRGLYTRNPSKDKSAKFIPEISWNDFEKMALKIRYKAGQNFVLDQSAAVLIRESKIKTYIIGSNNALNNLLRGKKFAGTLIHKNTSLTI